MISYLHSVNNNINTMASYGQFNQIGQIANVKNPAIYKNNFINNLNNIPDALKESEEKKSFLKRVFLNAFSLKSLVIIWMAFELVAERGKLAKALALFGAILAATGLDHIEEASMKKIDNFAKNHMSPTMFEKLSKHINYLFSSFVLAIIGLMKKIGFIAIFSSEPKKAEKAIKLLNTQLVSYEALANSVGHNIPIEKITDKTNLLKALNEFEVISSKYFSSIDRSKLSFIKKAFLSGSSKLINYGAKIFNLKNWMKTGKFFSFAVLAKDILPRLLLFVIMGFITEEILDIFRKKTPKNKNT